MQRSQGCGFSNVFLHATFCYFFGRFEMQILVNNLRGRGLKFSPSQPVSSNSENVRKLISKCPVYAPTPLHNCAALAKSLGIKSLFIKDERPRMGLGSFKALGATYAIAKRAAKAMGLSIAGVDILRSSDGPKVLEVNSSPGLRGIEEINKINIAAKIIDYLEKRLGVAKIFS